MLPKITHVIFDMDGLILDSEDRYETAYKNLVGRYGKDYPFELKMKVMGRTGLECAQIIIKQLQLPLTPEQFQANIDEEYAKVFADGAQLMPGAERLIRHLHSKRIPIAIATSSKQFTFDLKTRQHRALFELFDHILIASADPEVTKGKPDPETFVVCASRFKPPPSRNDRILVFEDSPMGVLAANAAGMISVWVPDPRMPKDYVQPCLTLNSLEEFRPEQFSLPPYDNFD